MKKTGNFGRNARILALCGAAFFATAASAQNTVITADKMIDVLTGKVVEFPAIFVGEDGRIASIADARTVRWGSDVKHINLSGKTLLPGLIDMHVHLDGPADKHGRLPLVPGKAAVTNGICGERLPIRKKKMFHECGGVASDA